jgi:hypothetical protein
MSEPQQATIVLYEVFTGTLEDGRQVMVQVFRKQGQDKSMFAQLAFRDHSGQSWSPPVRFDDRHQITETSPS